MADAGTLQAGSVDVACPVCEESISLTVSCTIENNEYAHLGEARLVCTPDMSEMWMHMWVHEANDG